MEFIDILEIRLSECQQTNHGQQNVPVFDLWLRSLFRPHTVGFFDQIRLAEHLSYER